MLQVLVHPLPGSPREHLLDRDEILIGRSGDCDVPLGSKFVSRHHARIFRGDDGWLIEDLSSRNGTVVNGERIEAATPIGAGDVIHVAHYSITFDEIAVPVVSGSHASQHSSSSLHLSWH